MEPLTEVATQESEDPTGTCLGRERPGDVPPLTTGGGPETFYLLGEVRDTPTR